MKILIIKMSSLGDVVHLLPALTDAAKHDPQLECHWVVEEAFAEISAWHPAVKRVIPIALRRWRKRLFKNMASGEMVQLVKELRREHYDLIIDAQGLLKSALIAALCRGPKVGFDLASVREKTAPYFYQTKIAVAKNQHAVMRLRELFAEALNYPLSQTPVDYGIHPHFKKTEDVLPYVVFLHGTTWATKLWIEDYWLQLAKRCLQKGLSIKLFAGNETELARAKRIQQASAEIEIFYRPALTHIAGMLINAKNVIAVDTGLLHLAAALHVPSISVYGPTDPNRTGSFGQNQKHLASTIYCAPCLSRQCTHPERNSGPFPPCMRELTVQDILNKMQ